MSSSSDNEMSSSFQEDGDVSSSGDDSSGSSPIQESDVWQLRIGVIEDRNSIMAELFSCLRQQLVEAEARREYIRGDLALQTAILANLRLGYEEEIPHLEILVEQGEVEVRALAGEVQKCDDEITELREILEIVRSHLVFFVSRHSDENDSSRHGDGHDSSRDENDFSRDQNNSSRDENDFSRDQNNSSRDGDDSSLDSDDEASSDDNFSGSEQRDQIRMSDGLKTS